jgi:hypothetical protein
MPQLNKGMELADRVVEYEEELTEAAGRSAPTMTSMKILILPPAAPMASPIGRTIG